MPGKGKSKKGRKAGRNDRSEKHKRYNNKRGYVAHSKPRRKHKRWISRRLRQAV
jgi:hypothetical protein